MNIHDFEKVVIKTTQETKAKLNEKNVISHAWMQHLSNNILFNVWKKYYQEASSGK